MVGGGFGGGEWVAQRWATTKVAIGVAVFAVIEDRKREIVVVEDWKRERMIV